MPGCHSPTFAAECFGTRTTGHGVFEPAVKDCQKADGTFPSITPHDLRHTAASLAVSAGANVKVVQRMLGHAKASGKTACKRVELRVSGFTT